MKFVPAVIPGVVVVEPDVHQDRRGFFLETYHSAKFREAAARALLLPRHRPQGRAPLWQQRKRAYDLLQVASRFGSFPMIAAPR